MTDWVGDTGAKRSGNDTEAERRPVRPLKPNRSGPTDVNGFHAQLTDILVDTVMEKAVADKWKEAETGGFHAQDFRGEEHDDNQDEGNEDEPLPSEDRGLGNDDDELEALRARRMKQIREAQAKRDKYRALGHGSYDEIQEQEFIKTVCASERCIVHFYHRHFERCKIMDLHLGKCAQKFFGTRFVKLDSEKAPFFVEKLKVRTLPCAVIFIDGVAKGRQVGFDGLEGGDELSTSTLAWELKQMGGMEEDFGPDDEV